MTIDSHIPPPVPGVQVGGKKPQYPFKALEVGQSILVRDRTIHALSSLCCHLGKRLGRKFTLRTTAEGVRVWRIE